MRTLVWTIGAVVLVDVAIVAWFVLRELVERRRARHEIRQLNALWRAPSAPQLRLVHSAVRRRTSQVTAGERVVTLEGPVLALRPRARQASLAAFAAALTALVVILAFDVGAPAADRAATDAGPPDLTWTFEPRTDDVAQSTGAIVASAEPEARPAESPPPLTEDGPYGAVASDAPAPDRVAAEPRSTDAIVLAWESVPEAVGYVIERWDVPVDASAGWTVIGETEADATSFVDSDLEPDTTYYYRVSAVTEDGAAPSDVVSATTLPGPPDAPVIVASSNGSTVKVEWSDVNGESGYRVERADGSGDWATIATVGQDVLLYVDGGLEKGATYGYRVVATSENGDSPPSNVVSLVAGQDDEASTDPGSQDAGSTSGGSTSGGSASIEQSTVGPSDTDELAAPEASDTVIEAVATEEPIAVEEPVPVEGGLASEGTTDDAATSDGTDSELTAEG